MPLRNVLTERVVQSLSSLAMSASAAPQTEVEIPNQGDLVGLVFILTQVSTGTLVTPNPTSYAIQDISIKDKKGNPIWQNIRGQDLVRLKFWHGQHVNGKGINTAETNSSTSSATTYYYVPLRVDTVDQPVRYQATIAPFSAMAASGTTGGTVSFECTVLYKDEAANNTTDRDIRLTQSVVSGTNRFAPNLPRGRIVNNLNFTIGTESNLTTIVFSRDGSAELTDLTAARMIALDQDIYNSGHVTGRFDLYNSPFVTTENTLLDVTASGSDTVTWFVRISEPAQ